MHQLSSPSDPQIIDVRLESDPIDTTFAAPLRSSILSGLSKPRGKKTLPSLLLYDERGLRLYDSVTTNANENYYLFPAEEEILREKGAEIVNAMHGDRGAVHGEVVLELGSG
jgi:uncharacterized SAM-dependent methyltransferase